MDLAALLADLERATGRRPQRTHAGNQWNIRTPWEQAEAIADAARTHAPLLPMDRYSAVVHVTGGRHHGTRVFAHLQVPTRHAALGAAAAMLDLDHRLRTGATLRGLAPDDALTADGVRALDRLLPALPAGTRMQVLHWLSGHSRSLLEQARWAQEVTADPRTETLARLLQDAGPRAAADTIAGYAATAAENLALVATATALAAGP